MADVRKAKAKINIAEINAEIKDLNSTNAEKSVSEKLFDTFANVQNIRNELTSSFKKILYYRNIVGQDVVYSGTASYYSMKITENIAGLAANIKLLKETCKDSALDKNLTLLQKLIAQFLSETDSSKRKQLLIDINDILHLFDDLKELFKSDNIIPNDIIIDTDENGNPIKDSNGEYVYVRKDNISTYITFTDNRRFKNFYGKVKNRTYIAQQAMILGTLYNEGDPRLYFSVPIVDMNYVAFRYTKYAPLDFWPINLWWTDYRFISERYQIENPDAKEEDQSDQYKTVYAILYFNGSRFMGSDEIKYNDIHDGDTDRVSFITESSNSNYLTGTIKYTKEVNSRNFKLEFEYDDEEANISERLSNRLSLSDSVKITMRENTTGRDPYVGEATLSLDTELSDDNECSVYTGSMTIKQESEDESENEYESFSSSSSVDLLCYVTAKGNNRYDIKIALDPDSTSNQSKLEMGTTDDIVAISIATGEYKNILATNVVNSKSAGMYLAGALDMIGSLEEEMENAATSMDQAGEGESFDYSKISSLLSDILRSIGSISNKANKEITNKLENINSYLTTLQNIIAYMSTSDSGYIEEYVHDLTEAIASMKTSMEEESAKDISESDIENVCKNGVDTINGVAEQMIKDALFGIDTIEFYSNNYEVLLPEVTVNPNIENTIDKWIIITNGRSIEKSAYSSMGTTFYDLPLTSTYDIWKQNTVKYIDNDTYIYPLAYLSHQFKILLKKHVNYNYFIDLFNLINKIWYRRKLCAIDIFSGEYIQLMDDRDNLYEKYGLKVEENINKSFVNALLTNTYPELNFYNNIDLSEMVNDELSLDNVLNFYKVGMYGLLVKDDRNYLYDVINDIYNKIINSKATLRDYVLINSFLLVINDVQKYASDEDNSKHNEKFNDALVSLCQSILKSLTTKDEFNNNVFLPRHAIDIYIRIYKNAYQDNLPTFNNGADYQSDLGKLCTYLERGRS